LSRYAHKQDPEDTTKAYCGTKIIKRGNSIYSGSYEVPLFLENDWEDVDCLGCHRVGKKRELIKGKAPRSPFLEN